MQKRTKVLTGAVVGVVVLGVGLVVGPRLYADSENSRVDAAPTLTATADAGAVADGSTDGTWTIGEGSFAGYRVDEVLQGNDVTVTGRTEEVSGTYTVKGRTITLTFPGRKPVAGKMTPKGVLQFEELGTFLDSPSECEA